MTPYIISDLLSRLQTSKTKFVSINFNLELLTLLNTLQSLGYLTYKIYSKTILISITPNCFSSITIHSKPSRRIFKSWQELWTINSGLGTSIIRTSHGFLSIDQARKLKIGGELLFTLF